MSMTKTWKRRNQMFTFNRSRQTGLAMAMLLALLSLVGPFAQQAQGKDNDAPPKIRLHVEITGVAGDGIGGSIDAFGSDQLISVLECDGCGGGAGKASFGPVVITKDIDSASLALLSKAAVGVHISQVKINWIRRNPLTGLEETYFSVLLTDVVISSLRTRLADQRDPQALQGAAVEDVGFKFSKIQMSFLRPDGTVISATYDV
jgi:type VI secretion system Hcp family effector